MRLAATSIRSTNSRASARRAARLLLIVLIAGLAAAAIGQRSMFGAVPDDALRGDGEFFEKSVRPLLAEHCYKCHGPAVEEVEGGLRFSSREAVLAGGDSGPAAVEGKPDQSLLIEAIRHDGLKMPPDGKLSSNQIDVLRRWIALGVPWPAGDAAQSHLATDDDTPSRGLSAAWQERLAAGRRHWSFQGVKKLAPRATENAWAQTDVDRFILATLDANGLSPSPLAERAVLIRRVTFDLTGLPPTPDEVDQFLGDTSPDAWPQLVDRLLASPRYGERWARHWLDVARYADTKGYVLFEEATFPWAYTYRDYVIRSLNEDLPYDRFIVEQLAADRLPLAGDKRALAAMGFLTLGNVFISNPHDVIDDRIDVVMRGFQGLTVTCARCHDHKFDPIPTRDYYSLYGVFASSTSPLVPPLLEPPPATPEYEAFAKELAVREQSLAAYVDRKYTELEQSARTRIAEYLLAANALRDKPPTDDFMFIADASDLNPAMIVRWQAYLARSRRTKEPVFAIWHALADLPAADFSSQAAALLAGFAEPQRATQVNSLILAAVLAKPPTNLAELAARYAEVLSAIDGEWREHVDKAQQESHPPAPLEEPPREALHRVFYGADSPVILQRTPIGDLDLLPDRGSQEERNKLLGAVEKWRATGAGAPPRAMSLEDQPHPYTPHVFVRGNPNNPREAVPRRFLHVLSAGEPQSFADGSGRLELAQAIANRDNPLTARVLVNRVWQHHFGAGLVRTPSDFGTRGEPPTHPELLDYLAATFMEQGWSLKQLHRHILNSAAYRQASADRPDCLAVDPTNRLLWKFPRLRLEFECLRDSMLHVSGRLAPTLYGPPNGDLTNAAGTRRTIYSSIDRLNLPGLLRSFDFPSPDSSNPQRDVTSVPQQALFFMNHGFPQTAASAIIGRTEIAADGAVDARVERLYRLLFARPPDAEELTAAREFLGAMPAGGLWVRYAQGLLMSNEFAFID